MTIGDCGNDGNDRDCDAIVVFSLPKTSANHGDDSQAHVKCIEMSVVRSCWAN